MPLTITEFVARWSAARLSERSGSHSHFIDLCDMLGQPHPAAADGIGERFTFEKPVSKVYGGYGFADVWRRDHFAWEYKESRGKKHKDLKAAYKQLNDYREDLGNPPLLVVCDMDRFEVHTNFPNTKKRVYAFNLSELERNEATASCPLPPMQVLHALFGDYNELRPDRTDAYVTEEAAKQFARLAERLEIEHKLKNGKEQVAHFLMQLLFCLFADSVGLLPNHLFRRLIDSDNRFNPPKFLRVLGSLFRAMAQPDAIFGEHIIPYFNGNLFRADDDIVDLDKTDLSILHEAATRYNWAHVAPAIFGTLFERSLDPARRSLVGAHYTSEEDIRLLIEPVVMQPLQERWSHIRASVLTLLEHSGAVNDKAGKNASSLRKGKSRSLFPSHPEAERLLARWFDELADVRILDPACGSGNFLYTALRRLLDLWKEAYDFSIRNNIQAAASDALQKMPSPLNLSGIETEFYAHELASIVVWIGYLQWRQEHGIAEESSPLLRKLDNVQHSDAILRYDAVGQPYEPEWPAADFIVGNPPFLGGKLLRRELGDKYVDDLFQVYDGRVKAESDLVVYWFEKARAQLEVGHASRVGLLATQGIRGGANRRVLQRIQETGRIFWAWSDRDWLLDGASVHVSMVGFESTTSESPNSERSKDSSESSCFLDGEPVSSINPDLTSGADISSAVRLRENRGICFMGTTKVGPFDIDVETAKKMLCAPLNPNGRPNSDVVKPWVNALDITRRPRNMFIIDFGTNMPEIEAALYELPFEYVKHHVKPERQKNNRDTYARRWWVHGEPRPDLRRALKPLSRYILTSRVSKHRLFAWLESDTIPDSATFAIARDDDYFFGVLHSTPHELWALQSGTQLESRPRYTPDSCFDTFPFPWSPGTEPSESESPIIKAIADAARELVRLRDNWLNPKDSAGQPLSESELKKRTLTNLYNQRPAWLDNAHRTLDEAVFAAYGLSSSISKDDLLRFLLDLNLDRANGLRRELAPSLPPKKVPRKEVSGPSRLRASG